MLTIGDTRIRPASFPRAAEGLHERIVWDGRLEMSDKWDEFFYEAGDEDRLRPQTLPKMVLRA